jgi:deoxyribose-phosphate aldolase
MNDIPLEKYIDHTLLKATATEKDIENLCKEAIQYNFYAVCVNSSYVSLCKKLLKGSDVMTAAVVGFPLGAMHKDAKVFEAEQAIRDGADEIDMVIHIGMLKSDRKDYVQEEISAIKKAIGDKVLKVIIETCYLTQEEKEAAIQMCVNAGAEFVKTSTGFGTGGATLEDIRLMKKIVGDSVKIKASGGLKDSSTAQQYIEEGISRIGTSSGIEILKGLTSEKSY